MGQVSLRGVRKRCGDVDVIEGITAGEPLPHRRGRSAPAFDANHQLAA